MIKFFLSLALLLLSFSSCCRHMDREHIVTCEAVRLKNQERLEKEGFYTLNDGYFYPSTICGIMGSYVTNKYRFTTFDKADTFFHSFVKEYLKPFNKDPCIRPYLSNFPLTSNNLQLAILFLDEDGTIAGPPYIASIRLIKGEVYYDIYDKSTNEYSPVRKETFTASTQ